MSWQINKILDKVHLTTRQAIQLHSLSIDGVCDIMEEAIHKDIIQWRRREFPEKCINISIIRCRS